MNNSTKDKTTNAAPIPPPATINVHKLHCMLLACKPGNTLEFASNFFEIEALCSNSTNTNNNTTNISYMHKLKMLPYLLHDTEEFQTIASLICVTESPTGGADAKPDIARLCHSIVCIDPDSAQSTSSSVRGERHKLTVSTVIEVWFV